MRRCLLPICLPSLTLCLAVLPIAASGQTTAGAGGAVGASAANGAATYRLRAGDAVRLLVRDEPELGGEYAVLEDGTVPLPLIGLVQVGGMAFGEVVERVRAAYAAELVDAMVVLQPLIRVRVLGEVRLPGLYLVDATFGLRDVLAQAGGAGPSAAPDRVVLIRGGAAVTYELESAAAQHVLQPGDEIVVPRRGWVRENMPILVGAGTSVLAAALTALLVR